jgi:hypothetical protein
MKDCIYRIDRETAAQTVNNIAASGAGLPSAIVETKKYPARKLCQIGLSAGSIIPVCNHPNHSENNCPATQGE